MTLAKWGRAMLLWGSVAALIAALPAIILYFLPPEAGSGFVGIIAILLTFSVLPMAALIASVGAILLLVGVLRRDQA